MAHHHLHQQLPLTAEALARYQAMQQQWGGHVGHFGYGAGAREEDLFHPGLDDDYVGAGEEDAFGAMDEDGTTSTTTDSSKQSVARRRHARRRRQLARLAAERLEWEERSRQMEMMLTQQTSTLDPRLPGASHQPQERNLFADFRKALARALLLTTAGFAGCSRSKRVEPESQKRLPGEPKRFEREPKHLKPSLTFRISVFFIFFDATRRTSWRGRRTPTMTCIAPCPKAEI